jgi:hypothetical protein
MFMDVVLQSPGLEDIVIGCVNTPKRGFFFAKITLNKPDFLDFVSTTHLLILKLSQLFTPKI